tara:strand:- start:20 stop:772 length:753 start_codon:yes stop_codon:yes gene_type:complete
MANPHEETAKAGNKPGYSSPTGTQSGRPNPHTDTGFSHETKTNKTHTGGSGNGNTTTTKIKTTTGGDNKKSTGFVPLSIKAAGWVLDKTIGPWAEKQNKKSREKFARKEGLYRDYYRANQYNTDPKARTLDVMSTTGKDYLKDAGYGPFQDKKDTRAGDGGQQRCPDGTMPPCAPTTTAAPVAPTTTSSAPSWQLYPEDSDYITGKGYDTGGGVRKGPPPKRGPNPQVPPLLFSRGGGAAVKGTKFKGVK